MNVMTTPLLAAGFSTGAFLDALRRHDGKSLTFIYGTRAVAPGYHVTEIKTGAMKSLDCGANPEAWAETIIQLWDVDGIPGEPESRMTIRKFLAIMGKFDRDVGLVADSTLTFEVSDPQSPLALYGVAGLDIGDDRVTVALAPRPASCKPRDRWLEQERRETEAQSCCGPASKCCA